MKGNHNELKQRMNYEVEKIKEAIDFHCIITEDPSFESGNLGLALFYIYYSYFDNDLNLLEKAESLIFKSLQNIDIKNFKRHYSTDSFDNHLAHLGRFIEFINNNRLLDLDTKDFLTELDSTLFTLMKSKAEHANFDYQGGALAAGYYFLSRMKTIEGRFHKEIIYLINQIKNMAKSDSAGGIYWETPVLYNRVYLGISHGSSLIISFVSNVMEMGIETTLCAEILTKASIFLLRHESNFGRGLFPNYLSDLDKGQKQFSLCYGDIGVGYALLRAGQLLEKKEFEANALRILDNCLTRRKEDNLTHDASITYGASGLATTFEKIYDCTQNPQFLTASDYWYEQIPDYATFNNNYAGYKSRVSEIDGVGNLGFSWGIAGIGTVLMQKLKSDQLPIVAPLMLIA